MKYIELLGHELKSEEVIDFLELYQLEVIYDFDRLHAGMPDSYSANAYELGLQLMFDETQRLGAIYCYFLPEGGFSRCDPQSIGLPVFETRDEFRSFAKERKTPFSEDEINVPGINSTWIRIEYPGCQHHWEFRGEKLYRLTVMLIDE